MINEEHIKEQSNGIENFPFLKGIFNDNIVKYLNEEKGIFTIDQFLQMSRQDFSAFCLRSLRIKRKIIANVHDLGYKFAFEIEDAKRKEQEKQQKIVDTYNNKVARLERINSQIEKLQLMRDELTSEIENYSKQYSIGNKTEMSK